MTKERKIDDAELAEISGGDDATAKKNQFDDPGIPGGGGPDPEPTGDDNPGLRDIGRD